MLDSVKLFDRDVLIADPNSLRIVINAMLEANVAWVRSPLAERSDDLLCQIPLYVGNSIMMFGVVDFRFSNGDDLLILLARTAEDQRLMPGGSLRIGWREYVRLRLNRQEGPHYQTEDTIYQLGEEATASLPKGTVVKAGNPYAYLHMNQVQDEILALPWQPL